MQRYHAYFLRFCSLAVCFVLCLLPLNAYANTYVYNPVDVTTGQWAYDYVLNELDMDYNFLAELGTFTENFSNVTSDLGSYRMSPVSDNQVLKGSHLYQDEIRLYRLDGASLAKSGESIIVNLSRMVLQQNGYQSTTLRRNARLDPSLIEKFTVSVVSADGEIQEVISKTGAEITNEIVDSTDSSRESNIHFEVVGLPFDITQVIVDIYSGVRAYSNNDVQSSLSYDGWNYSGSGTRYFGSYDGALIFEVEPKSSDGMLSGIIEWVRKIYDGIINLPQNIWLNIKAGLMELFVPDETFMLDYKDNWEELLSGSLGGVYEAVELVDETAEMYMGGGHGTGTIEFPMVHIPVGKNQDFTFGGWEVEIVPDRGMFHVLLDALKLIVNALATFYVINSFKRRFERTLEQ